MAKVGPNGCRRAVAICCCGVAVRIGLALSGLQPMLAGAMELVVSSTSWERAQEGYFLGTLGLSHYAGGVFSGSPFMLAAVALCAMLPAAVQALAAATLFAAADLVSALLLRAICVRAVAVESGEWETRLEGWMDEDSKPPSACSDSSQIPLLPTAQPAPKDVDPKANLASTNATGETSAQGDGASPSSCSDPAGAPTAASGDGGAWSLPDVVLTAYLLNPVLAGQCAALSGDVLGRVLPLVALAAAGSRRPGVTAAALAAASCLWRFYAAPLILPAALMLGSKMPGESGEREGSGTGTGEGKEAIDFDPRYIKLDGEAFIRLLAAFTAWCGVILGACWLASSGSWAFLTAAARGQLLCENLTPNIGLYWYFFAEVFPRFRGFFRVLFLSQPYVYVLPATLRLGMFPEALASLLLAIFGLFQPYPTLAEPILAGCLFLCHPRTSARMRLVIPVGMVALVPSLLLPTMRHLWLQAGTGNANFYYFQTVVLNVLLAVFVLQFAAALVKRRKALRVAFQKRRKAEAAAVAGGAGDGEVGRVD
ncbi:unnamed protein product [Hapterophycus canaliculatus]